MTNEFLPSRYVELIERLALGIEPIDSQRSARLTYPLQIQHETSAAKLPRPPIERHQSNLYALRYQKGIVSPLQLRFFDSTQVFYRPEHDRRRIVARRFSIPILDRPAVETAEKTEADGVPREAKDFRRRVRRPVFFPGAAYDFSATTTGLRGRVMRDGKPMRWARITATLDGSTVIVGRAHGDDRGEFLLLINATVTSTSAVPKPLAIKVTVTGPLNMPIPTSPEQPAADPLWDLPVETMATPGDPDPAANGETVPWVATKEVNRVINFSIGECLTGEPDFVIT